MTLFFLVVGLEAKRELDLGECQELALDTSNFYECAAALSVRFERVAIFSARRSSASRSSSGRRTIKEQSRPASTRAIQSKLQVTSQERPPFRLLQGESYRR